MYAYLEGVPGGSDMEKLVNYTPGPKIVLTSAASTALTTKILTTQL